MRALPHPGLGPPLEGADDAVFRPVRAGNAFEETVEHLLGVIRLGRVRQGERLPPQRDLARRLNISRVTLREALRSLEDAGYVETHRGRQGGTVVVHDPLGGGRTQHRTVAATLPPLGDALAFRLALEPSAAAQAAAREVTSASVATLRSCLDEAGVAPPGRYREADSRLHLAIAELSGSPSLIAAIVEVRRRLNDLLDAMPLLPHNLEHSSRQHERIVRAVLSGDPPGARAAMEEHLAATGALLRGFLG